MKSPSKSWSRRQFIETFAGGVGVLKNLPWLLSPLWWTNCGSGNAGQAAASENPIQLENRKAGDADWELADPAFNHEIEGYASAVSLNRGESITFFVNTTDPSFSLDIYRMGWYGGAGARKMQAPVTVTGRMQPIPQPDGSTGLIECSWTESYVLHVPGDRTNPTDWPTGIYLAKLTGSSAKQTYIIFVVRDDGRISDLLFQNTVTTYQAYNDWGGLSLYTLPRRAYAVSFNRPYGKFFGSSNFFRWEYFMVRFLEREGYDVSYSTDVETHDNGNLLLNHKGLVIVGHDEYWSSDMRHNVEAARDAGVNLAFFAANNCYWQVRFAPSPLTGASNRTMICYKQATLDPYYTDGDPSHKKLVTVLFRDEPVNNPEASLMGVMFDNKVFESFDIVISDPSHWIFENCGLTAGSHLPGLLGYEADRVFDSSPTNTVALAQSPYVTGGESYNANMSVYTAPSGSTVVAAGTFQWSWGLDDFVYNPSIWDANIPYNYGPPVSNRPVQQATRNILDRFIRGT